MSFAVVKFINENNEEDVEVVSEVPISWLFENNTMCKWPPEKYASIYITKSFPPQDDWAEYPVIVEHICESLAQAKQRTVTKTGVDDKVGRGCRKVKPIDYFSPAEEEERAIQHRKKETKKGTTPGNKVSGLDYQQEFLKLLNPSAPEARAEEVGDSKSNTGHDKTQHLTNFELALIGIGLEPSHSADSSTEAGAQDSILSNLPSQQINKECTGSTIVSSASNLTTIHSTVVNGNLATVIPATVYGNSATAIPATVVNGNLGTAIPATVNGNSATAIPATVVNANLGTAIPATVVSDSDIQSLNKKLDSICTFLSQLKLDISEIKEKIDSISPPNNADNIGKLPIDLPLISLSQLEKLEDFINLNEENKQSYVRYLKSIGGNDHKDFTLRICRSLLTNSLAETCSWLGRKNNYALGHLQITILAFGVVHQKTRCSRKDFEGVFAEWLRHAKQRRLREEKM